MPLEGRSPQCNDLWSQRAKLLLTTRTYGAFGVCFFGLAQALGVILGGRGLEEATGGLLTEPRRATLEGAATGVLPKRAGEGHGPEALGHRNGRWEARTCGRGMVADVMCMLWWWFLPHLRRGRFMLAWTGGVARGLASTTGYSLAALRAGEKAIGHRPEAIRRSGVGGGGVKTRPPLAGRRGINGGYRWLARRASPRHRQRACARRGREEGHRA